MLCASCGQPLTDRPPSEGISAMDQQLVHKNITIEEELKLVKADRDGWRERCLLLEETKK